MEIFAKLLHPDAVAPHYANDGDAGCDLVAVEPVTLGAGGGRALVATGLAVAIPEGHGGFVLPRSGLASRHGVTCANAPGLIDPGYRGEVKVALVNLDPEPTTKLKREIASLNSWYSRWPPRLLVVDDLPDASRGEGGFGSSGR